jgi:hypothetical protein
VPVSKSQYKIFEVQGKLLLKGEVRTAPIDVSQLAKGLYLLQVQNLRNEVKTFKFLKD